MWMPAAHVLDVLLIGATLYPGFRWVLRRLCRFQRAMRVTSATVILVLLLSVSAQVLFVLAFNWMPVRTIGSDWDGARYRDYRPVGVTSDPLNYDCKPSTYWFGVAATR